MGHYSPQSHELQDLNQDVERGAQLARQPSWLRKLVPGVNPSVVLDSGASIRSTNSYVVEIMIKCELPITLEFICDPKINLGLLRGLWNYSRDNQQRSQCIVESAKSG